MYDGIQRDLVGTMNQDAMWFMIIIFNSQLFAKPQV